MCADSQGAIALAKTNVHHQKFKHVDIKYNFLKSEVQSGVRIEICTNKLKCCRYVHNTCIHNRNEKLFCYQRDM